MHSETKNVLHSTVTRVLKIIKLQFLLHLISGGRVLKSLCAATANPPSPKCLHDSSEGLKGTVSHYF